MPQMRLASAESASYLWGPGACPLEKCSDLGLLECISSILKQKLECLNRTQTSLIFGFWGVIFKK